MAKLHDMFARLGFEGVTPLLQSGNVVFDSPRHSGADLESLLEKETAKRLNVSADYIVRTAKEWQKIVARNPFPSASKDDPGHLVVMCLKSAVAKKQVQTLELAIRGREVIHGDGQQLYIVYPDGIGKSKFTAALIERTLEVRGTARNWNTVLKLAELCT
jgi:uncharacterized protein (DUF1697 family)